MISIEELQRREREWKNSIEGIASEMSGDVFTPRILEGIVYKTLQKLPQKVREFVYRWCTFISIEKADGIVFNKKSLNRFVVILGEKATEKIVAHEIAHCFLKHPPVELRLGISMEESKKIEKEAWDIVREWGYRVTPKDYAGGKVIKKKGR